MDIFKFSINNNILLVLTVFCSSPIYAQMSQDLDPAIVVGKMIEVVCVSDKDTGSFSQKYVRADADVGVSGVMKGLVDAGLSGKYMNNEINYVNALKDGDLAEQIKSEQDCRTMIFQRYDPLVRNWIEQISQNPEPRPEPDNNVNINGKCNSPILGGSGNTTSVNCN